MACFPCGQSKRHSWNSMLSACYAHARENPGVFRQFPTLCKHLKINFYLIKINGLSGKIIVDIWSRFRSDMRRLNSWGSRLPDIRGCIWTYTKWNSKTKKSLKVIFQYLCLYATLKKLIPISLEGFKDRELIDYQIKLKLQIFSGKKWFNSSKR